MHDVFVKLVRIQKPKAERGVNMNESQVEVAINALTAKVNALEAQTSIASSEPESPEPESPETQET